MDLPNQFVIYTAEDISLTKHCVEQLEAILLCETPASKEFSKKSIIGNSIAKKINRAWGTENDISILAEELNVTSTFSYNGRTVQPIPEDNQQPVIHLNNINNGHWKTIFDPFSTMKTDALPIKENVRSFTDHMSNPFLTLNEINELFQSYQDGNHQYSFFGFFEYNSRNHLHLARLIQTECTKPGNDVDKLMQFIHTNMPKKYNENGDFARRVDYLFYRYTGNAYAEYQKTQEPFQTPLQE